LRDAASTIVPQRQISLTLNSLPIVALAILLTVLTACGGGTSTGGNSVPPQASLQSIQITGASSSLTVPSSTQLSATGKYSDGTTKDLTQSATWSSSNTAVAAVVGGLVTSMAQGTATIQASFGSVAPGKVTLTINPPALISISIASTYKSIALGTADQFFATGTFSDGSTKDITASVTWSSSAPPIATISNSAGTQGLAKGIAPGPSTIVGTSGTVQGSASLTVTNATIASIAINPSNASIPLGTTQPFSALGTFSDNSIQDITSTTTWNSSNNAIASITISGVATARKVGTVTWKPDFGRRHVAAVRSSW
jgi:hypothetical protein